MPKKLYTIGHSTHTLAEFLAILHAYQINHVVDIRTVPKSRHVPWFNKDKISSHLYACNIAYTHMAQLGGLRPAHKNSINLGWHNISFRSFADYMQKPEFFLGLKALNKLIKHGEQVAIMCAEAVPWRCHRSLIADAEAIRHISVWHIVSLTAAKEHRFTSFAKVDRKRKPMQISYPAQAPGSQEMTLAQI